MPQREDVQVPLSQLPPKGGLGGWGRALSSVSALSKRCFRLRSHGLLIFIRDPSGVQEGTLAIISDLSLGQKLYIIAVISTAIWRTR